MQGKRANYTKLEIQQIVEAIGSGMLITCFYSVFES